MSESLLVQLRAMLTERQIAWLALSSGVPLQHFEDPTDFERSRIVDAMSRLNAHEDER